MYNLRVVAMTPSIPSAFASTVTKEQTTLDDPNGVWQKDRGGKFNNYLNVDLEVHDLSGRPVQLQEYFFIEAELRIVMDNDDLGGVIDRVSRESKRIMNKHLEGSAEKLWIIDADPHTGGGLRVGGSSKTTVKVKINELSKKGSRNSRYTVLFRVTGPGSERFINSEDTQARIMPLTVYSKLVRPLKDNASVHLQMVQAKEAAERLKNIVEKVDPSKALLHEASVVVEILEACRLIQRKLEWQQQRQSSGRKQAFEAISNAIAPSSHPPGAETSVTSGQSCAVESDVRPRIPMLRDIGRDLSTASFTEASNSSKRLRTLLSPQENMDNSFRLLTMEPGFEAEDGDDTYDVLEHFCMALEGDDGRLHGMSTELNVTDRSIRIELFDENADGRIDAAEMRRGIARLEIPLTEDMHRRIFEEFDVNKDGVISVDEFIEGVKRREAELLPIFRKMDTDGDGYLTYEELRNSEHLANVSDEAIRELIEFVDSLSSEEPDGQISEREFIATFTMLPSGADLASLRDFAAHVNQHRRSGVSPPVVL